ncbi:MAG: carboxypeptidase-like regulatory domain-containing protein, partial [Parabacteroides sp.]|nr:carboxypeptidase-like regulatory domain-containing protein [Parabacteroides sp.]
MNYTRIFIRRRFGLLLLAVFIFLSSPRIFAMENAEGITIPLAKVTLAEAIKKIEAASDYTFFYDAIKTNLRQQVTLKADNQKIEDVLNLLLKTTDLQYKITDHQIALIPRDNFKSTQSKKKITGVVVDETGIPVIGANVVEAGTTNGTITDLEGKFSLDVPLNADLLLTYVGYVSANLKVGSADHYNVQLALDSQGLDEVIVVGYGTVKKKDLTGAVASLQGDLLSSRKTTQLSAALQGAVAGVLVTRDNSAPGATAGSIKIRGVTTIGDSSPLVIVDGVPGDINQVNPN